MKFLKNSILILTIVVFSCNKEKDEIIKEKTKLEMLTDGEWSIIKREEYEMEDFIYEEDFDIPDFFYTFKKDKTFIQKYDFPGSETTGTWEFIDDKKSIKLTIMIVRNKKLEPIINKILHVYELTEELLIMEEIEELENEDGEDYEYKTIETFKRSALLI